MRKPLEFLDSEVWHKPGWYQLLHYVEAWNICVFAARAYCTINSENKGAKSVVIRRSWSASLFSYANHFTQSWLKYHQIHVSNPQKPNSGIMLWNMFSIVKQGLYLISYHARHFDWFMMENLRKPRVLSTSFLKHVRNEVHVFNTIGLQRWVKTSRLAFDGSVGVLVVLYLFWRRSEWNIITIILKCALVIFMQLLETLSDDIGIISLCENHACIFCS